jgi:hypothetical protein
MKSFCCTRLNYLLLTSFLLVTGCATWLLGPVYSKIDKIPDDAGLVYFYRPSALRGVWLFYDVKMGETVITRLYNGGYYPYFSVPGETEFWAEYGSTSSSVIRLDVKAGQTYYIRGEVVDEFLIRRLHLVVVAPEIAEKEIVDCKLIPAP